MRKFSQRLCQFLNCHEYNLQQVIFRHCDKAFSIATLMFTVTSDISLPLVSDVSQHSRKYR